MKPIIAKRAFLSDMLFGAHVDDAERAGGDAVAATVACRFLNINRVEFGADDGPGRADFETRSIDAVLTDVGEHQPIGSGTIRAEVFDELDVAPVHVGKTDRVVVRESRKRHDPAVRSG